MAVVEDGVGAVAMVVLIVNNFAFEDQENYHLSMLNMFHQLE